MNFFTRAGALTLLILAWATPGSHALGAISVDWASIAEKELEIAPPSQDRIIMGSSSVLVRNLEDEPLPRNRAWSMSFQVRRFTPAGELEIITGDRYDLAKVATHPMFGAEICRDWAYLAGNWQIGSCLGTSGSTTRLQLETKSGYLLSHVRLTHLVPGATISAEKRLSERGLWANVQIGGASLLVNQSSTNPTANASSETPFLTAAAALRWNLSSGIFAKGGYQFWKPIDESARIPTHHVVLTGGFRF